MKVKDPYFTLEKIEKYLKEDIFPSRIREAVEISHWKYFESAMEDRIDDAYSVDYDDSGWKDFKLGDKWGGYDRVAWFRADVDIPAHLRGKSLAVKLLVGPRDGGGSTAETLMYVDGQIVQGMDIWHEEALLDSSFCAKERLSVALKAWSGVLDVPPKRTFKLAQLIWLDQKTDRFYYTVDTLRRCALQLEEGDLRRIRLVRLLNETFLKVNFLNYKEENYYEFIYDAMDFLQGQLDEMAKTVEIKPHVYGVGHSHIDLAWLWRLSATREKASRTFASVLNLMRQYPEYRYMHSSPQLYKFLKKDYPEIYARVKQRVEEGCWEITGGMWVEADTNIPSGESLVRQFIYGKRFIREEFGKETTLVWLPDVFGYSAALPQIMKKSGIKYFMTTKISWNQYNHFPHDTFWWKGIDGSKIFAHFITTPEDGSWYYTYNGHMDPEEVVGIWKNYKDKDKNEELLIAYGWGDGGGGPTREMLEQSRVMKNIPGIPEVSLCTAESYFERIYQNADLKRLGTWEGELYFELHRGTYTSQAANKHYNRKTEILLHDIEFLSAYLDAMQTGFGYPKQELDEIWERTLLNQFHDILPGSSIRQVYEDTTRDYEDIAVKGKGLLLKARKALSDQVAVGADSVLVINTAGFARNSYVYISYGDLADTGCGFEDETGKLTAAHEEAGVFVYVTGIPAYGYKTLRIVKQEAETASENTVRVEGDCIESPFYELRLNGNGEIAYLHDKENGRQIDCGQPMNVFAAFEDKPQRFDAWDVDVYYKEKPYPPFVLKSRQIISQGERAVLRQSWMFNQSTLTQDMILYAKDRRIDFETTVDWKEKQVFLKAYFPVNVHAAEAAYEIQFGNIRRPTHTNTEWDFARFEVSAHKWADLSEGKYGVALLNDCKYGYDVQGNVLGISLIKSAVHPDETADRKVHHFTYSLYPHAGDFVQSNVQQAAVDLNMPILTVPVPGREGAPDFASTGLVKTDCDHVLLDTVKRSEDGGGTVVRLYEYKNQSENRVSLRFAIPVKKVYVCNLCEEEEQEIPVANGEVFFDIGCYEIKTFKIY